MTIFHFKPVVSLLEDPAWLSTPYHGECWVNAADEQEARGLISGRHDNANTNISGNEMAPSPWLDSKLVTAEVLDEPPSGMSIPNGVVVADRQM